MRTVGFATCVGLSLLPLLGLSAPALAQADCKSVVAPSPFGPDDQTGATNRVTPQVTKAAAAEIQTGVVTPMYPGGTRNADIAAGAGRTAVELVADVRETAAALAADITALPVGAWTAVIDTGRGGPVAADVVLSQRLAEVELYHHDFGLEQQHLDMAHRGPPAGPMVPTCAATVHCPSYLPGDRSGR